SVAPEAVGHEPFARHQKNGIGLFLVLRFRPGHSVLDDIFNRQFFFHTSPPHNVPEYSRFPLAGWAGVRDLDIYGLRSTTWFPKSRVWAGPAAGRSMAAIVWSAQD